MDDVVTTEDSSQADGDTEISNLNPDPTNDDSALAIVNAAADSSRDTIRRLFAIGAQYGYIRRKRHPSVAAYIFGAKNNVELFDLEKTNASLEKAKGFIKEASMAGKVLLMASSKFEAIEAVKNGAMEIDVPFVTGRWIGGTLTNFPEIRKRLDRLVELRSEKDEGQFAKYTKKEQALLEHEIFKLECNFGGILNLKTMPDILFVVDPREEHTAVREALHFRIPIVAVCGSDCDITKIDYPIVANDSGRSSIEFFVKEIVSAYKSGRSEADKK